MLDDADCCTLNALRWTMTTGDKYEPYRDQWAYSLSPLTRNALTTFVERGGALLGIHTASICFDDWDDWYALLGGQWQWGTSFHPPAGPVTARATRTPHWITEDVSPFTVNDEVYHHLRLAEDVDPLVVGSAEDGDGEQPVLWAREVGAGRVVYNALGHDETSMQQRDHRQLMQRSILWLLRMA